MLETIQISKCHLEAISEDFSKISSIVAFTANQLDLEYKHEFAKTKPKQDPAMTTYQLSALMEMLEFYSAEKADMLERFLLKDESNADNIKSA